MKRKKRLKREYQEYSGVSKVPPGIESEVRLLSKEKRKTEGTKHKIIIGDSRNMKVRPVSVHLVVTSPPYWRVIDYGVKGQIGFGDTYKQYIRNLNKVWRGCYHSLHEGCKLCINIADTFNTNKDIEKHCVNPIHIDIIRGCKKIGFRYMGMIMWRKLGIGYNAGSYLFPRNGNLKVEYEFILVFKKDGTPPKTGKIKKRKSKISKNDWIICFNAMWNFKGVPRKFHKAPFPLELPYRLIKMYSMVGETVLDPFMGSGTTALAAKKLGRNSIGYELDERNIQVIKNKVAVGLFDKHQIKFKKQVK